MEHRAIGELDLRPKGLSTDHGGLGLLPVFIDRRIEGGGSRNSSAAAHEHDFTFEFAPLLKLNSGHL
jgi:hypothetical protein